MGQNGKSIRLTFSIEELQEYYAYIGGRIRMIEDGGAIRDQRPSSYLPEVTALKATQERIATAIREHQAKEAAPADQMELQR